MKSPQVLFAGTPEFALASLKALVDAGTTPAAVFTQPDRPAGRGKQLRESPVKRYALDRGIEVLQPATLRDDAIADAIGKLRPDIFVVAAYGLILPQAILDIPRRGCVNVHASLLPRWRGAAPVQAAIFAGDAKTGISLMSMTTGLDCGPVCASESIAIGADETAGELHDRLAILGGELLVRHFDGILAGSLPLVEQDESEATYAARISTPDAAIDWRLDAVELQRHVRAFNPVPGAWFPVDELRVKCWRASVDGSASGSPGTVLSVGPDSATVACGSGALRLESVQRAGKRPVTGAELAASLGLAGKRLDLPA